MTALWLGLKPTDLGAQLVGLTRYSCDHQLPRHEQGWRRVRLLRLGIDPYSDDTHPPREAPCSMARRS